MELKVAEDYVRYLASKIVIDDLVALRAASEPKRNTRVRHQLIA